MAQIKFMGEVFKFNNLEPEEFARLRKWSGQVYLKHCVKHGLLKWIWYKTKQLYTKVMAGAV